MPRSVAPLVEAARVEYLTAAELPSLRNLAAKYGVSARTVFEHSRTEGWVARRAAHLQRIAADAARIGEMAATAKAAAEADSRARSAEILTYMRDGLAGAFQIVARDLVVSKGMTREEADAIVARWKQMAVEDRAGFLLRAPRALADTIRALELVEGRPTERHEFLGAPDIELSPEAEAEVDMAWRKLQEWRRDQEKGGG